MKKSNLILIVLAMVLGMSSTPCNAQAVGLKEVVHATNQICPISMGVIGDIAEVDYVKGNVVFTCEVDEQYVNVKALKKDPSTMHETLLAGVANPSSEMRFLIETLVEEKAGMSYILVGTTSGVSATITLTAEEIRKAWGNAGSYDPVAAIKTMIQGTQPQLPMEQDEGIVWDAMFLNDNMVTYRYEVDESLYSITDFENSRAKIAQLLRSNLQEQKDDPMMSKLIKTCVEANVGLRYLFVGAASGYDVFFDIPASELKRYR